MDCDLKLTGGSVLDGTGTKAHRADVAVRDGTIAEIGDLGNLESARAIDCTGKTIVPGFIDIHSHADWLLPGPDHGSLVEPFVRQGMTSVVTGNCGFSPAPLTEKNRAGAHESSRLVVDEAVDLPWETMGGFLDALDGGGVSLNVAQLVGHGTVRAAVTGQLNPAPPDREELRQMEALAREALDAGCAGISSGLGYPPGIFAGEEELTEFARWAAREEKLFTSHLKAYSWISGVYDEDPDEEFHNLKAIREILRVAAGAAVRLQISHLIFVGRTTWPSHPDALRLIEDAHEGGIDVAFDAFPYTAGNTTASVLLPAAILPRLEEILGDPVQRDGLRRFADSAFERLGFGLGDIQIMRANVEELNRYDGWRVTEAAKAEGEEPFDFYCRLVIESRRNARVLNHTYSGDGGEEEPLRAVLAHPLCTVETDTFVTREGHQNPAAYGTFPRVLTTYVREGLFSFEEAVHRMTGAAADRLGWTDRGFVRQGCAADLVVLDTERLEAPASLDDPKRFPVGIDHVFINGQHLVDGDAYDSGTRAGHVIRA
jgi:N-acyl-D-aspartate/D-glutamate deacylase